MITYWALYVSFVNNLQFHVLFLLFSYNLDLLFLILIILIIIRYYHHHQHHQHHHHHHHHTHHRNHHHHHTHHRKSFILIQKWKCKENHHHHHHHYSTSFKTCTFRSGLICRIVDSTSDACLPTNRDQSWLSFIGSGFLWMDRTKRKLLSINVNANNIFIFHEWVNEDCVSSQGHFEDFDIFWRNRTWDFNLRHSCTTNVS